MAKHNWRGPVANIWCNGIGYAVLTQVWSNHSLESALLDTGHLNFWHFCPRISWCLARGQMCAKQVLQEVQSGGISQTIKIGCNGNSTSAKGASKDNGHSHNSPHSDGSVCWEGKQVQKKPYHQKVLELNPLPCPSPWVLNEWALSFALVYVGLVEGIELFLLRLEVWSLNPTLSENTTSLPPKPQRFFKEPAALPILWI